MNPVENPMTHMMQAFGATSTQSVAAMYGLQSATGDMQTDYAANFAGFVEAPTAAATDLSPSAFEALQQRLAQAISASPAEASYRIDPTAAVDADPIIVQSLPTAEQMQAFLQSGEALALAGAVQQGNAANLSLQLDYSAATPLALGPAQLEALQALSPEQFASLEARAAAPQQTGLVRPALIPLTLDGVGATLAAEPAHILPAAELRYFIGEAPQLPAGLQLAAQPSLEGTLAATPTASQTLALATAPTATAAPTATPNPAAEAALAQASTAAQPPATGLERLAQPAAAATPIPVQDATLPLTEAQAAAQAARDARTAPIPQQAPADQTAEDDAQTEAQLLAVQQKANTKARSLPQFSAMGQESSAAQQSNLSAQAQAIAALAPKPMQRQAADPLAPLPADAPKTDSLMGTLAPDLRDRSPLTAAAPKPALPQTIADMQLNANARASFDVSSPWSGSWTPERAAGWSDTLAPSMMSMGLGGLVSDTGAMASMTLLGGRPNPMLGAQIAKQLNVNVTRAVKAGDQHFAMRMDPPELGRVMVKLKFAENGLVRAHVMAERPETLELLQREVRGLERAVEAGGHKAEAGGISFSLDSGGEQSAGRAFAEALQEDRLKEEQAKNGAADDDGTLLDDGDIAGEEEIDLDEILAHVTPETGLDVRI